MRQPAIAPRCPLCTAMADIGVDGRRDALEANCETCGIYLFDTGVADAFDEARETLDSGALALMRDLAAASRWANHRRRRLHLTAKTWQALAREWQFLGEVSNPDDRTAPLE
jgi:hypothetical protein